VAELVLMVLEIGPQNARGKRVSATDIRHQRIPDKVRGLVKQPLQAETIPYSATPSDGDHRCAVVCPRQGNGSLQTFRKPGLLILTRFFLNA
jgi:hypothetical protein